MQTLQLLGLLIVATIAAVAITELAGRDERPRHSVALAIGAVGGLTGAALALSQQIDLVPDPVEAIVSPILVLLVSATLLLVAWRSTARS